MENNGKIELTKYNTVFVRVNASILHIATEKIVTFGPIGLSGILEYITSSYLRGVNANPTLANIFYNMELSNNILSTKEAVVSVYYRSKTIIKELRNLCKVSQYKTLPNLIRSALYAFVFLSDDCFNNLRRNVSSRIRKHTPVKGIVKPFELNAVLNIDDYSKLVSLSEQSHLSIRDLIRIPMYSLMDRYFNNTGTDYVKTEIIDGILSALKSPFSYDSKVFGGKVKIQIRCKQKALQAQILMEQCGLLSNAEFLRRIVRFVLNGKLYINGLSDWREDQENTDWEQDNFSDLSIHDFFYSKHH